MQRVQKWALRALGLVLFVFILLRSDLEKSLGILGELHGQFLVLSIALVLPMVAAKAFRWQILLRTLDINLSYKETLILYGVGLYGGVLTPGQVGDFIKAYYLQQRGCSLTAATKSVLLDRLFDLGLLIVAGCWGLIRFSPLSPAHNLLLGGMSLIAVVIGGALALKWLNPLLDWFYRHLVPARLRNQNSIDLSPQALHTLASGTIPWRKLITALGWSVVASAIYFVRMYGLVLALDVNVSFASTVACIALTSLVTLLPVSVAGLGTRDATLIYAFNQMGIGKEYAIDFSLLILLLVFINGGIGFIAWEYYSGSGKQ